MKFHSLSRVESCRPMYSKSMTRVLAVYYYVNFILYLSNEKLGSMLCSKTCRCGIAIGRIIENHWIISDGRNSKLSENESFALYIVRHVGAGLS